MHIHALNRSQPHWSILLIVTVSTCDDKAEKIVLTTPKETRQVTHKHAPVTEELAPGRPFQSGLIFSLPVCLFCSKASATVKVTPNGCDWFRAGRNSANEVEAMGAHLWTIQKIFHQNRRKAREATLLEPSTSLHLCLSAAVLLLRLAATVNFLLCFSLFAWKLKLYFFFSVLFGVSGDFKKKKHENKRSKAFLVRLLDSNHLRKD